MNKLITLIILATTLTLSGCIPVAIIAGAHMYKTSQETKANTELKIAQIEAKAAMDAAKSGKVNYTVNENT